MPSLPDVLMSSAARRAITLGSVSCLLIMVTSGMRGWPFPSLTAEPWIFQFNGAGNAWVKYSFLFAFYLGCAGLCWAWVKLLNAARSGDLPVAGVFWAFGIWSLILFFATPLFSGDVYVYAVDGEAMQRGFDPYESGISAMGSVPHVHLVHPLWRDTTTMYGPIFIRLVQAIAVITNGNLIVAVFILRALAVLSVLIAAVSLKRLMEHFGRPVASGLVFAILNPISMLHLVGGAHNDAMMVGLLAAGLAMGLTTRGWALRFVALGLCAAAGAFKIPGFAGALVLGWVWAGVDVSRWRRVVAAGAGGAVALGWFELQTLVTGMGWGWVHANNVPGLAHPLLSIPNAVALSFGNLVGQGYPLNDITRPVALLVAGVLATWLIVRTGTKPEPYKVVRAFGWAILIIAWVCPAVYPWYLAWGIALVGAMGTSKMYKPLVVATCAVIFVVAPGGYGILDIPAASWRTVMAFLTASVMAYGIYDACRRNGVRFTGKRLKITDSEKTSSVRTAEPLF
jgi:alpha-1,6-mannosyltransferase